MLNFFHKRPDEILDSNDTHKVDKRFVIAAIILSVFIIISIVSSCVGGTFKEVIHAIRFHSIDAVMLAVLGISYLIYRSKRRKNNDE